MAPKPRIKSYCRRSRQPVVNCNALLRAHGANGIFSRALNSVLTPPWEVSPGIQRRPAPLPAAYPPALPH
eukprot:5965231-Lingulodinium_polyedra.AAC.1